MKVRKLIILLLVSLVLTSCSSKTDENGKIGKDHNLNRQDDREATLYKEIEKDGTRSDLYLELADIYIEKNDRGAAIDILKKGLNKASKSDHLNLKLGEIYISQLEFEDAKMHLKEVEEKSDILAAILMELGVNSNDGEFFGEVVSEYKNSSLVEKNPKFFEDALIGYSKYNEGEKMIEILEKIEALGLKINPVQIIKLYGDLVGAERLDIARSLLDKDIYDEGIINLANLHKLTESDSEKEFIGMDAGYFQDKNRLDIVVLYGYGNYGYYEEYEIVLINGDNGEVIGSLKEDSIYMYMSISKFDISGSEDHIISLWGHPGGTGTPSNVILYKLNGDKIEEAVKDTSPSPEIRFKDNFEWEVVSKELGTSYLLQLELENVPYYISQGYYDGEGRITDKGNNNLGFGYEHAYTSPSLNSRDYILCSTSLTVDYDFKEYIGSIENFYRYENGKLILDKVLVSSDYDGPLPFNYKDRKDYRERDFKDYLSKKLNLVDFLSFELGLLDKTEESIKKEHGKPMDEGWYDGKYLAYENFIVFISDHIYNKPVASVWTKDLLGLKNSENTVVEKFGPIDDRYEDDMYGDYHLVYYLDDIIIDFVNVGKGMETPYIEVWRK